MSRPKKGRKVCSLPANAEFFPANGLDQQETVSLGIDEYEAIRLIDYQNFTQEECAGYMGISRTTAQDIYSKARYKLARMLVEALPLRIDGGVYRLCDGREPICCCGGCTRHRNQSPAGGSVAIERKMDIKKETR